MGLPVFVVVFRGLRFFGFGFGKFSAIFFEGVL